MIGQRIIAGKERLRRLTGFRQEERLTRSRRRATMRRRPFGLPLRTLGTSRPGLHVFETLRV